LMTWSGSLAHLIVGVGVILVGWIALEYLRRDRVSPGSWPANPVGLSLILLCTNQGHVLEYGVRMLRSILDRGGAIQGQVIVVDCGSEDDTASVAVRLAGALHGVEAVVADDAADCGSAQLLVRAHRRALYSLILCCTPVDARDWENACDLVAVFLQAGQNRPSREGDHWRELKQ
jgi:hypothetical protein